MRDYGTGEWEGGDTDCDHPHPKAGDIARNLASSTLVGTGQSHAANGPRDVCGKCGARRVDKQLGLEATPDAYVANLVQVFREVRRVLRRDGTCWLNLGDSYTSGGRDSRHPGTLNPVAQGMDYRAPTPAGLKPKDLVGIPWRVAFALQNDGWWLRSAITWCKPAAMPESVTDRPTKATEMIFMLTRSPRYFFDQEAVRERAIHGERFHGSYAAPTPTGPQRTSARNGRHDVDNTTVGRNIRDWWVINPEPFPESHFAVFPQALVERCVKAGTSEHGVCGTCGAPWTREVDRHGDDRDFAREQKRGASGKTGRVRGGTDDSDTTWSHRTINGTTPSYRPPEVTTKGWMPSCDCYEDRTRATAGRDSGDTGRLPRGDGGERRDSVLDRGPLPVRGADPSRLDGAAREGREPLAPVPATILDPFIGSGTSALVARRLGRRCIGIELNPEYAAMAARRLSQLSLLADIA